ncbi:unnamed protein product [Linum trigynum]|uniref:Uncharacterized protein n=1 Tax=Linum trigynum TaxID=586398 RepID=A0AAV2FMW8_9ROSI
MPSSPIDLTFCMRDWWHWRQESYELGVIGVVSGFEDGRETEQIRRVLRWSCRVVCGGDTLSQTRGGIRRRWTGGRKRRTGGGERRIYGGVG